MLSRNSDREWEKFGKDDPYFGVLTDNKYRKTNLSSSLKEEFFQTGSDYVDDVLDLVRNHINDDISFKRALDFGCGVGRLVIPLAMRFEEVIGVDVSESMLIEADKNCKDRELANVKFIKSDDKLALISGDFSFIHSYIVFQHIPVLRGEKIFRRFLEMLCPDGVCVLHFVYASLNETKKYITFVKKYIPFSLSLINLLKRKEMSSPHMQMNEYNLNNIFAAIQKSGATESYIRFTNHGGELGVLLFFRRNKK